MTTKQNTTTVVTTGEMTYASLRDDQRATLLAQGMGAGVDLPALMTRVMSDEIVSDEDAVTLGMVRAYTVGLNTGKGDVTVYRRVRRGSSARNLDSFLAGVVRSVAPEADSVVYVLDSDGDEVTVNVRTGETDEDGEDIVVATPIVQVRGGVAPDSAELMARLADGSTVTCESGKRVSIDDCGGDLDRWHAVREFSRDGGETWSPVAWVMRLPRKK